MGDLWEHDVTFDNEFAKDLLTEHRWLIGKNVEPIGLTGYFDIYIFKCDDLIFAYDTNLDQMCYLGSTIEEMENALQNP